MATKRENCAARLFGAWAVEPKWLARAVAAVKAGTWAPAPPTDRPESAELYSIGGPNADTALIPISDQITKGESSFGGTSSVAVRKAVRAAAQDDRIRSILLIVSSPGGTVAGTGDLADDIAAINLTKPVYAFCEDLAASAAYWIASQARAIFAAPSTLIGSIGTYAILEDTTGAQEIAGVKLIVVSSAELKGKGADGKVDDVLVSDVQREVDSLNSIFLAAVSRGRKMPSAALAAVATGQVWIASEAKGMGLIDEVLSIDAALSRISKPQQAAATSPAPATPAPVMPAPAPAPAPDPDAAAADNKATYRAMDKAEKSDNAALFQMWKSGDLIEKTIAAATRARRAGCDSEIIASAWRVATTVINTSSNAKDQPMNADHTAQAETEWSNMTAQDRENWYSRDVFIKAREIELDGRMHGVRKAPPAAAASPIPFAEPAAASATTTAAPAPAIPSLADAKARAKAEWASNAGACHASFWNESVFVAFRTAELRGRTPKR